MLLDLLFFVYYIQYIYRFHQKNVLTEKGLCYKLSIRQILYKFNVCESVYKVVLRAHQSCKGKTACKYLKVTMTQVPFALEFAGYTFNRELLSELFGATSKKGMTVKKLRGAITHGIDEKAVKEITNRKDELFGYMNDFLNTIRSFDQMAA